MSSSPCSHCNMVLLEIFGNNEVGIMFLVWVPISCRCVVIVHPWIPRCQGCEHWAGRHGPPSHFTWVKLGRVILSSLDQPRPGPAPAGALEGVMTPSTRPWHLNELNIDTSVRTEITRWQLFTRSDLTRCSHSMLSSVSSVSMFLGKEPDGTSYSR